MRGQTTEVSRLIRGLRFVGWADEEIDQLILYVGEGGDMEEKLGKLKATLAKE